MRVLSPTVKRPRGVERRLRALARWAATFDRRWPSDLTVADRYDHWKIPILMNIVEGRHAEFQWQVRCAQSLVDAADLLRRSKPPSNDFKVVAAICWPNIFGSEVCLYASKTYFEGHVGNDAAVSDGSAYQELMALRDALAIPHGLGSKIIDFSHEDDEQPGMLCTEYCLFIGETTWA